MGHGVSLLSLNLLPVILEIFQVASKPLFWNPAVAQRPLHRRADIFTTADLVPYLTLWPCWEIPPTPRLFFTKTSPCHHTSSHQALLLILWTFLFSRVGSHLPGAPLGPAGLSGD